MAETDPDIGAGHGEDLFGSIHQHQQRPGDGKPGDHQSDSSVYRNSHGCMNRTAHSAGILCPEETGGKDIRADGNSDEDVDDKRIQVHCRADCRHGFMRCVMPDYDQIDRIEKQLKDIGKHQRHCEKHDFPKQRAVAHIDLIFAGCHWLSLSG